MEKDPLTGQPVEVLWVKGSGGDVGTIKLDGFATLYMDKLEALKGLYRGVAFEDEMVATCPTAPSTSTRARPRSTTPLHAYVPKKHVDHMHPDAIIAIAAAKNSKQLTEEIFGGEIGWLPWKRPGFELGLWLEKFCRENPTPPAFVLESHGLFTWGDTAKDCYETTIRIINKAIEFFDAQGQGKAAFGGQVRKALEPAERRAIAAKLMPAIRGMISDKERKVGHFDDQDAVMEFIGSRDMEKLAALGHQLSRPFPAHEDQPAGGRSRSVRARSRQGAGGAAGEPRRVPQGPCSLLRALQAARKPADARSQRRRLSRAGRRHDHLRQGQGDGAHLGRVLRQRHQRDAWASTVSDYMGLPEQEAFDIEYWILEEAKLQRLPKPRPLAGRVALVTGGAGGIGRATASRLLAEGACVVLADIDEAALESTHAELGKTFGSDFVRGVTMNVTVEGAVVEGFTRAALEFGGIDILVSNAGSPPPRRSRRPRWRCGTRTWISCPPAISW